MRVRDGVRLRFLNDVVWRLVQEVLYDHAGFDDWWHDIDTDTQHDIIDRLAVVLREEFPE